MLVAMGPKGKGVPSLQGTRGLDDRGCDRDVVARWLRGIVRFYPGERCSLLHPIALIMGRTFTAKTARTHRLGARRDGVVRN